MARKKKPVPVVDAEHGTLISWVNEADDVTIDARNNSEKARDYYDSKQITAEERAALIKRKQAPVVINRCKPKMDALMGMEQANKTTVKAFPRTPKHEKSAEACTESIRFVLQDNVFSKIRSAAWENILIEGTGGCEVIVEDPKVESDGMRITINPIMWDRIIHDPHSRRKDFSDAKFLGQVVWMDYDDAADLYPEARDVLENMQTGSQTYDDKPRWMDGTRRRVKIVELYYHKGGEVWYSCFTRGGYCIKPEISPYKNEEGETEWPYEFGSAFVDREGGRYGAMLQLLDVQDEINKRRSKALHLMSVRQVRWERGAVEDINKARQELAKPDGVIETTPGMEFEVLKTGDMAAAQFNLLTEAKEEIDAVGANAATQGKDKSVQSGVALQRREQAGQTEIGPMLAVLKDLDYRVYRKIWNRIKQYWKAEKWIRVTDDENNLRWVGLNAPITKGQQLLQQAQEQGADPQILQQLQQKVQSDPMMQEVVDTHNDIAELDVDLIISEVPDALTSQIEDFQVLGEMVKSGFQMPPIAVIEASPLTNKDKIIKMMKEQPHVPPEMQKQLETQQEQMKKLSEENQSLKAGQQDSAMKIAARKEEQRAELELKREVQAEELRLAKEKTDAEIELKRATAQADYEIEHKKLDLAHQSESKKLAMTHENQTKQMEFDNNAEAQKMQRDEARKASEKEAAEKDVIPSIVAKLEKSFGGLEKLLQKQVDMQKENLEATKKLLANTEKPRKVSLGSVQRKDGEISGATVTVQ